jgi:hypothetical protein
MFHLNSVLIYSQEWNDVAVFHLFLFTVIVTAFLYLVYKRYEKFWLTIDFWKIKEVPELDNYIFDFNARTHDFESKTQKKKITIGTKIVLFSMTLLIAITPLYDLIETLRPQFQYYSACINW